MVINGGASGSSPSDTLPRKVVGANVHMEACAACAKGMGIGMELMGLTPWERSFVCVSDAVLGWAPSGMVRSTAVRCADDSLSARPSTALQLPAWISQMMSQCSEKDE